MSGNEKILSGLQLELFQNFAGIDLWTVMFHHLVDRIARKHNATARHAFTDKMFLTLFGVRHVNGRDRINHAAVFLLWYIQIEAAVASLHMNYRNAHTFSKYRTQCTIGVSKQEQFVRLLLLN
ncbi:hypothetical protein D3C74_434000 [compost metagenome]